MTSPNRRPRVAVIGGGIAGLAAAHYLQDAVPGVDVTVFEGAVEVGGKLRLGEVAGLTVDVGAESMLNRRPEATELARAVGLSDQIVHPAVSGAGVWTRGQVRPLPPTLMGIPGDLAAAGRSGVLQRHAVLRASLERRLPPPDLHEDVGIGILVARRLGRQVRDRLVEPLLGGVHAGHADELSFQAALPQVVREVGEHGGLLVAAEQAVSGRIDTPATPVFAGIVGGVGRLPSHVARAVTRRGGVVLLNTTVRELIRHDDGWRVVTGPTSRPVQHDVDAVIVAVPAAAGAQLLRQCAAAAARELGRIEYASMAIVTVAVASEAMNVDLAGSGFLVPPVDKRVIKAATYASQKWAWLAGDTVVIRCSVGRHRDVADLQRDDSELVEAAMLDLREAMGLRAPLLDARVTRWGGALPQYAVGHLDRVRRIRDAVARVPMLEVCGAAYDGLGIPAVIATAQDAATRVAAGLAAAETMGS